MKYQQPLRHKKKKQPKASAAASWRTKISGGRTVGSWNGVRLIHTYTRTTHATSTAPHPAHTHYPTYCAHAPRTHYRTTHSTHTVLRCYHTRCNLPHTRAPATSCTTTAPPHPTRAPPHTHAAHTAHRTCPRILRVWLSWLRVCTRRA